ncbi:hypothetical protein B0H11DRAFT_1961350 [Mycena galericulata]|nr:hypothetical protein B0H11DRAFT_1961350 [Mycena galericulata]
MTSNTSAPLFPTFLPRDRPPAIAGTLKDGQRTPRYALGWVRHPWQVMREVQGDLSMVALCVLLPRWKKLNCSARFPGFEYDPDLCFGPGPEPHMYYLFAFNENQASIDYASQNDEFLQAWREVAGIPPEDEYTLRWYKLPVKWSTHNNPRFMEQNLAQD